MDTRLLKMFSAVARHGGLSAASRELHLTSSALSHGLKALESQLGTRLFDRMGNRLLLNQAGEQLLNQIKEPLDALDRAASSIKALSKWGQGRLRIGGAGAVCGAILARVIRTLHRDFAKLFLVIECGEAEHLLQSVRDRRIDLALTDQPADVSDLESTPMFDDELLFAFSSEHPWADGRALGASEVARRSLILEPKTTPTGQLFHRYLDAQGIEPTVILETANLDTMRELVKLNVGVAILPPWAFDRELAAGLVKMRPLGSQALRRRWTIVHRTDRRLSLAEEQFVKICRRQAAALRLDRKDLPAASQVNTR